MCTGPMQGLYHHIYDQKEVDTLKRIQDNLYIRHKAYLNQFLIWYIPSKYKIKRLLTIGDLYFKRYYPSRKRARLIRDAMSGDNLEILNYYSRTKRLWIYYKYQGERYNLDLEQPYIFWRRQLYVRCR